MDFSLSDEQELLVDTARALFANECPPAPGAVPWAPIPTLATDAVRPAPARLGGAGRPRRPTARWSTCRLFLIEAGAAVAPGPFLATAGLFVPLLRRRRPRPGRRRQWRAR